jgi:hypothetical protein
MASGEELWRDQNGTGKMQFPLLYCPERAIELILNGFDT